MDVRDVGWRTEPFLEVEVANEALEGSEFNEDCAPVRDAGKTRIVTSPPRILPSL